MSILKQKTKEGVKPISVVNVIDDTNLVHKDTAENITGEKTFTASPLVPTVPDASDSSTKAASTAFVQGAVSANDANLVHKTGDEQISGHKNFSNIGLYNDSPWVNIQATALDRSNGNTGNICVLNIQDGGNTTAAQLVSNTDANRTSTGISASSTGGKNATISVHVFENEGTQPYGSAPTPPDSSNSNHIATTEWVRSKIKSGTTDPGVGSNLESGAIYFVYE